MDDNSPNHTPSNDSLTELNIKPTHTDPKIFIGVVALVILALVVVVTFSSKLGGGNMEGEVGPVMEDIKSNSMEEMAIDQALIEAEKRPNTSEENRLSQTFVLADVNLTDVKVVEDAGKFVGTFSLQGKMGTQQNINYGIIGINKEGKIVWYKSLAQNLSVLEGEIKPLTLDSAIPTNLFGDISFDLVAETEGGLPLGRQNLLKKTFPAGEYQEVCQSNENRTSLICAGKAGDNVGVKYFKGSLFGEAVNEESLTLNSESTTLNPALPAGLYKVVVTTNGQVSHTNLRVEGAFGEINNVVIHEEEGELKGVVTYMVSPKDSGKVLVELYDEAGIVCAQEELIPDFGILEFSMTPSCTSGEAKVTLTDLTGKVLASAYTDFTYKPAEKVVEETVATEVPANSDNSKGLVFLVLGLVAVLGLLTLLYRNKKAVLSLLVLFVGFGYFFFSVSSVEAMSLGVMHWGPMGCAPCDPTYGVVATVNTDKSSYLPGENITFSASISQEISDAYILTEEVSSGVGYLSAIGLPGPVWDIPWPTPMTGYGVPNISTVSQKVFTFPFVSPVNSATFTLPGSMIAGVHFVTLRLISSAISSSGVTYDYRNSINQINFTVTAPPSVNLNFR